MSQPARANRLAKETSPYLLQHAHNPVDWYPWGPEALAASKKLDLPIFLSIGYSACHWCHVMERESFEDAATAALMNAAFVNVKVDREERPDLDEIYMHAVQLMTGHGGWPMSVWLTPDLKPFYSGTYFPPEDRHGMPGFRRVIGHIRGLWQDKRAAVTNLSGEVTAELLKMGKVEAGPGELTPALFDNLLRMSRARFDDQHGGWGGGGQYAPKFPHPMELSMLLRIHARKQDPAVLAMAELTLDRMARGGIYDQLAGGFHRYATDREWLVPHFEKMLYDNALLMRTYAEAFLLTGKAFYGDIARETADYVLRELQSKEGGIWSTQDADSEGEEGKFFVWTLEEVGIATGKDAEVAAAWFGVTTSGNWEHRNILTARKTLAQVAEETGHTVALVRDGVARARKALLATRERRVKPGLDDKILTAWNGLAIAGLTRVGVALGEPRYLAAAGAAAEFVWKHMRAPDQSLLRTHRRGASKLGACLEDYAFVTEGLLDLFEADGDPRWLERALALSAFVQAHFHDAKGGGYCFTPDGRADILVRTKQATESSIPSATAVTVMNELRLAALTGEQARRDRAVATMKLYRIQMEQFGAALCGMLLAADFHLADGHEIVLTGPDGAPELQAMAKAAGTRFPPHHVLLVATDRTEAALKKLTPLLEGRAAGKAAQAWVCRHGTCQAPVATAAELRALLAR